MDRSVEKKLVTKTPERQVNIACFVSLREFKEKLVNDKKSFNLSYKANDKEAKENGILYPNVEFGTNFYMISPIDKKAKYTEELLHCTSLVFTGKSKKTGEILSFITHINLASLGKQIIGELAHHLDLRVDELKDTAEDIDAFLLGGNVDHGYHDKTEMPNVVIKNHEDVEKFVYDNIVVKHSIPVEVFNPKKASENEDADCVGILENSRNILIARTNYIFGENPLGTPIGSYELKKKFNN